MAEYVKVNKVTSYIKGYAQRSIDLGSFDLVDDILTICENIKKMSTADVVSRETHEAVRKALQALAETDVVPVVRCKDCKHSKYKPIIGKLEEGEQPTLLYCTMFVNGQHIYEDDYCSYGERKTNNV
jgi:hypothetical protein